MNRALDFTILDWLSGSGTADLEQETLASLTIRAGADQATVTEVEDRAARTVRRHINVPVYPLARWLLANFWRLRWEPSRAHTSSDWLEAHSLAAVDGAHAWPALELASDGDFIQLRLRAEATPDAAAIRYLKDVRVEVPAVDFEQAVFAFVDAVEMRIAAVHPGLRSLTELREELASEFGDPAVAAKCRLQATAGIDPGAASADWFLAAKAMAARVGELAANELLAALPAIPDGIAGIESTVTAMHDSPTSVRLDWLPPKESPAIESAWSRGENLASKLRAHLKLDPGPLPNTKLEELLDVKLPLQRSVGGHTSPELTGGYRNGRNKGRTALLVPTAHPRSQRFYLARIIGAASQLESEHVLPVSKTRTALQKLERAFAAEFLCPWRDLDAFTNECGTDDDGIAEAAAHFDVSELQVLSSLVNKGKAHRSRLAREE